jgi:stress response protein YsnF
MMKISEVVSDIDRQRSKRLDKNAEQAAYQAKQERYRQHLKTYNERMSNRKPGAKIAKRPQAPKPPSLN